MTLPAQAICPRVQIPRHHFENLVKQYAADRYTKRLSTWNQFTALLYAQISGLESLREIENAFAVQSMRTYHLGLPAQICRNTLSHANGKRDWRIYEGMFYKLLARCRDLTPKHKFKFNNPLYSIDATTVSLCLLYQSRYPHSLYYLHMVIRAALMERISLLDTLNLSQNRLQRIRDDDLQPFLPFA